MVEDKFCIKCKEQKPIDEFSIDRSKQDGLRPYCKECENKPRDDYIQVLEKKCTRCNVIKPISDFNCNKSTKDGHISVCKECWNKGFQEHKQLNRKKCAKCKVIKPISDFFKNNKLKDGHDSYCKKCRRSLNKVWENKKSVEDKTEKKKEELNGMPTIFCPGCGVEKLEVDFAKNRSRENGRSIYCKKCIKKQNNARHRKFLDFPDDEYGTLRAKYNEMAKARNKRIKLEVLNHYSNGTMKCANPFHIHNEEVTHPTLLTIDHVNGDGYKEKDRFGRRMGGSTFYGKLIREGFPSGFQVLCWNCQMYKREINQEYGIKRYKRLTLWDKQNMEEQKQKSESTPDIWASNKKEMI